MYICAAVPCLNTLILSHFPDLLTIRFIDAGCPEILRRVIVLCHGTPKTAPYGTFIAAQSKGGYKLTISSLAFVRSHYAMNAFVSFFLC